MINLEIIVNICVLGKMRIAALISLKTLLFNIVLLRYSFLYYSPFFEGKIMKIENVGTKSVHLSKQVENPC